MKHAMLVLIFIAAAGHAQDKANTLQRGDIFELEIASDPQISPDGSEVVYTRQSMDIMTDRMRSSLWLVAVDGDSHRPLLADGGNYSSARWSPDGDRLAYVTAVEGRGAQLFVRWMDTGQVAMLTNLREAPSAIAWSPDGTKIAFSMFVPAKPLTLAEPPPKPEGAEWAQAPKAIDSYFYRSDGEGFLETGFDHVFVVPAEGGSPRQLTTGDYHHTGPLSWSPDGESIAFSANRVEDWEHDPFESEIWTVDTEDGELTQLTDRDGPDFAPVYSPDGDSIAYLGFDEQGRMYNTARVHVMDASGGEARVLAPDFDRTIDAIDWAGNSRSLYVRYDDRGRTHIGLLSMSGDIDSIAEDISGVSIGRPYTSGSFSVADNGDYAYTAGTPYRPADVAAGRRGRAAEKLTALNEDVLGHRDLGEVETLTYTSPAGGLEIQGWIVKPPGFDPDEDYPLILEIHGGPYAAYGPHFSAEFQLFAAAGYVVLYTNPRGSTSYGFDFANEIHHRYPGQDYDDLMAGVDTMIDRGYVNPEQLFVTGGSGGGVLTAWIVGSTDRFSAAVSAKPVINWASHTLTSDIPMFGRYMIGSEPWEDPEAYWARSPLSLVGNVTTPTMLLTGEQDFRTPIAESEQFYQALKMRKIDTALVRIPEASHGIAARPSQLIAKVDNILAWFERYRDSASD